MKDVIPSILIHKPTGDPVGIRAAVTKEGWESAQRDAQRIMGKFPARNTRSEFLTPPLEGDPIRQHAERVLATEWPVVEVWMRTGADFVPLDQLGPIPGREEELESLKRIYELLDAGEEIQAIQSARSLFINS